VTGSLRRPYAVVLGEPGRGRAVAVSLPLAPTTRAGLAGLLYGMPGERSRDLPGVVAGLPGSPDVSYRPVQPTVVVEVEIDGAFELGRFRHRPRVVRVKPLPALGCMQPAAYGVIRLWWHPQISRFVPLAPSSGRAA
jgi:hypothetical protein